MKLLCADTIMTQCVHVIMSAASTETGGIDVIDGGNRLHWNGRPFQRWVFRLRILASDTYLFNEGTCSVGDYDSTNVQRMCC